MNEEWILVEKIVFARTCLILLTKERDLIVVDTIILVLEKD